MWTRPTLEWESFSWWVDTSWVAVRSSSESSPCILSLLCTFFKCLPRLPDWEKVFWQNLHSNGFYLVCFLKWSLRLHDFLKDFPHFGNWHLNCNLRRLVSGFLVFTIWYHLLGIPSNVEKSFLIEDFFWHFFIYFLEDSSWIFYWDTI